LSTACNFHVFLLFLMLLSYRFFPDIFTQLTIKDNMHVHEIKYNYMFEHKTCYEFTINNKNQLEFILSKIRVLILGKLIIDPNLCTLSFLQCYNEKYITVIHTHVYISSMVTCSIGSDNTISSDPTKIVNRCHVVTHRSIACSSSPSSSILATFNFSLMRKRERKSKIVRNIAGYKRTKVRFRCFVVINASEGSLGFQIIRLRVGTDEYGMTQLYRLT
jgi:hypothetical protein